MGAGGIQNLRLGCVPENGNQVQKENHSGNGNSFSDMLKSKSAESQGLNFSKHAARRMDERGIPMDCQLMDHLQQAVDGARKKGARDVAVIGSQGVFIVNVPNNVVVTTMTADDMRDRVFTNIDSAVIM